MFRRNFSLQKITPTQYIVTANEVTKGVIAQIRSLLEKIPQDSVTINGRMFQKSDALRELVQVLTANGTAYVSF